MTEPSGAVEAVSNLYWHVRTHSEIRDASLPALVDGRIYGWRTTAGKIYAGEGYPVTPRNFSLDNTSCAELMIRRPFAPTPSDQEKRISKLEEALKECARVLRDRIPRIGPEGPNTAAEQQEYEEVGGAWSMADRALSPERSPK